MKSTIKFVLEICKVSILFVGCTILFYVTLNWIHIEYQNYHRYNEPEGSFIKVTSLVELEEDSFMNRLMYFYEQGE